MTTAVLPEITSSDFFRDLHPGMGQAVAERTILRKDKNGKWEKWEDVAHRVALGNSLLCLDETEQQAEFRLLKKYIGKAIILSSGRHLQHGDGNQPNKNQEIFTNCATAPSSFLLFYNLLNGSGVGRSYDDDMIVVNWSYAPEVRCVLSDTHPDFDYSAHESLREAKHKYGSNKDVMWFEVPDSREGWAKALEIWENAAFEKIHKDKILILDFSKVRPKGAPIAGMQNRPSSGPVPTMNAFHKINSIRSAGLDPWCQAMFIDHYLAECVVVGGARRAARIGTKYWKDKTIFKFITIKRPIEFQNKTIAEIAKIIDEQKPLSFLWSSNNSVMVDAEFWDLINLSPEDEEYNSELAVHARKVFDLATTCAYGDRTGEPGLINVDKLVQNDKDWQDLTRGDYVGSKKYQINEDSQFMLAKIARKAKKIKYHMIVNPCSEIALLALGGYCVIGDICPFFGDSLDEIEDACRAMVRFLMRTNTLDSVYSKEVKRTQRIGVGLTGVHEFAWKFFKLGFHDLTDEKKSKAFWLALSRFSRAIQEEAASYAKVLGVNVPHTNITVKPSGTTAKLFGVSEGWHLPAMKHYMRWVQFRHDDPLVSKYKSLGYPTRDLKSYSRTTIVGFPTAPVIANLGMGDKLITAGEATPEEQYKWVILGEKYWLKGCDSEGNYPETDTSNQISYTLKYKPTEVTLKQFQKMIRKYQSQIKCCSVMPQIEETSYEYQPEQPITEEEYYNWIGTIKSGKVSEDIGKEHIDCENGACPVDFKKDK